MLLKALIFLFLCVTLGECNDLKGTAGNSILDYLNSNSEQIYHYKNIKSLDILVKNGDVYDVKTVIEVECLQDSDSPCLTKTFSCEGKLQYKPESNNFDPVSVSCNPVDVIGLESEDEIVDQTTEYVLPSDSYTELPEISTESGSHLCTGCPVDINLDVEGLPILVNTALKHVESEKENIQSLVEIVRIQRQIVAGVKYILILKIAPTICRKGTLEVTESTCPIISETAIQYCKVEYLQQPWISKDKNIISNNCTKSQYFTITKDLNTNIINNDIDKASKASFDDISPARLSEMESQIVESRNDLVGLEKQDESQVLIHNKPNGRLSDTDKSFLDSFFGNIELLSSVIKSDEQQTNDENLKVTEFKENTKTTGSHDSNSSEQSDEKKSNSEESKENSKQEKTSETSEELTQKHRNKRELLRRTLKDDTSEETSEETTEKTGQLKETSEESSDTSEELKRAIEKRKFGKRNKRGTRDSRAQSSLEMNSDSPDVSINTLIKNRDDESLSSLSTEEDSITRHKRATKDNQSSSSSSSSSSSDDDNDNNNDKKDKDKKKKEYYKKDKHVDDNDTSSSSSSSSSDKNNNNKHKRSTDLREDQEKILVRNLAEIAAATLDDIDNDSFKRVVLDVENHRKTILEGTIYHLKMKTALSNCKESNLDLAVKDLLKHHPNKHDGCHKNLKENSEKTCKAQVHVTEEYTSPKVLKTECSKHKRETLPGGITNLTVDDPTIVELSHSTLALLDGSSEHAHKYKVVEITSASKQVVSGVKYRISLKITLSDCPKNDNRESKDCGNLQDSKVEKCDITIWDQKWLEHGRKTSISCDNKEPKRYRTRRDTHHLVGGVTPISVDDPVVKNLTEHTLRQLDGDSSLDNKYKVKEILSASQQIVAGVLYKIQVKIAPSDCLKTDTKDREECGIGTDVSPQSCTISIWDRPWLPNGRETKVTCDKVTYTYRSKRSLGRKLGKDDYDVQLNVFRDFKDRFNKIYPNIKEERRHFRIFRKNLAKIEELNLNEKGTAVYGITKFSDLTYEEFRKKHMGFRPDLHHENEIPFGHAEIPNIELPTEFDWRTKGAVTEVKDQAACGSCWAFSVTGNVEGQYAIQHKKLVELSEQELVDCDKYDEGCNGGLMDNAYRAIEQIGGLELESDYPYDAEDENCHYNRSLFKVRLSGAVNISHDENDMAKWLTQNGPISIAINANAMQFYVGGVSHPLKFLCSPKSLDHGVLIVGYGVHTYPLFKKSLPFWIVKNSWGKSWGEQGYYRVYRGDGTCGLNQTPSSAVVV